MVIGTPTEPPACALTIRLPVSLCGTNEVLLSAAQLRLTPGPGASRAGALG